MTSKVAIFHGGGVPAPQAVAPAEEQERAPELDLRLIWSILNRNRMIIAAILAVALIGGVIVTLLTTARFRSAATVQVEQQASKILNSSVDDDTTVAPQEVERFLQTQLEILNSRALANRVAETLGLYRNDDFLIAMGSHANDGRIGVLSTADSKRERVLRTLRNNLDVSMLHNSRIVTISFSSADPVVAARVANSYADNFVTSNIKRRFDTSIYARNFLEEQLNATRRRLEDSEQALIGYARAARLIDASAGASTGGDATMSGPRSLTTTNLVLANQALAEARNERIAAQERYEQAMRTPLMNLSEVLANPAIQNLEQVRAQLNATYQQELQRRTPQFPAQKQIAAQIAELDRQITDIATAVRSSLRDQYETARSREKGLTGSVEGLTNDTLTEQNRSIRYNILRRDADTNRSMYEALLQRFKEVSASAGISASNLSIIDRASVPALPYAPRASLNLAFALIIGLALAALAVFVREKFDDSVRTIDDVNNKLGIRFLASTPMLPKGRSVVNVIDDKRSSLSEAYSTLRTTIELLPQGMLSSILVCSGRPSEGKSTTAYALAKDFALSGRSVVLVDGDLRKPSLHSMTGVTTAKGFSGLLARLSTVEEVLQPTSTPNLSVIAAGPLPPAPAELLSGVTLPAVMGALRERFDLVVVDGPPLLGLADALVLAANVDGTLFVVEANGSSRGVVKTAIRRLQAAHINILGAVLTKFDPSRSGAGDAYGYSYYQYSAEPSADR